MISSANEGMRYRTFVCFVYLFVYLLAISHKNYWSDLARGRP